MKHSLYYSKEKLSIFLNIYNWFWIKVFTIIVQCALPTKNQLMVIFLLDVQNIPLYRIFRYDQEEHFLFHFFCGINHLQLGHIMNMWSRRDIGIQCKCGFSNICLHISSYTAAANAMYVFLVEYNTHLKIKFFYIKFRILFSCNK